MNAEHIEPPPYVQDDTLAQLGNDKLTSEELLEDNSRFARVTGFVKRGIQAGIIAAELSPANEILRYSIFAASQATSSDPLMGALAYGGATFVIEASAALATADALDTETARKSIDWINGKLDRFIARDAQMSLPAEAGLGLLGGSVVAMAAKQRQEPERTTEQNRRYGLFTSSWLAGVCAVQGALMSEGIHNPSPETIGAALIGVGGVLAAAKWAKGRFTKVKGVESPIGRERQLAGNLVDVDKANGYTALLLNKDDPVMYAQALELERDVWQQKEYGDATQDYEKYEPQEQVFMALNNDGECIGVARVFNGTPELPPFLESMSFNDEGTKEQLIQGCQDGLVEELATVAVREDAPLAKLALSLWRLAYRDAYSRGIKTWGIIMEPNRVKVMNIRYGFNFKQVGPTVDYQGGECAPHTLDLEEVRHHMSTKQPKRYNWFVNEPIGGE